MTQMIRTTHELHHKMKFISKCLKTDSIYSIIILVHVTSWPYLDVETTQRSGAVVAKSHHQGGRACWSRLDGLDGLGDPIKTDENKAIHLAPRFIIQIYQGKGLGKIPKVDDFFHLQKDRNDRNVKSYYKSDQFQYWAVVISPG